MGRWKQSVNMVLTLVILAVLALFPSIVTSLIVYFSSEAIIWALFSLSFNQMLGHSGMMSFGHAAFFGLGAYTYAILSKKALLWFPLALTAAPIMGALSSLIIGFFCVRHTRLYFAFLTFAFGQMIFAILYRMYDLTGGDDGLIGVPVPHWLGSSLGAYYFSLGIGILCLYVLLRITKSPLGTVLHAIRDNPERAEFSGIKVWRFKLASFVIGGSIASVAGALYAILTKAAFLEYLGLEAGVLPLFACLLGGMYTFFGPIVGATLVVALDKLLGSYTQYWSAVTGAAVILIIIAFPKGILGFLRERVARRR